MDASVKKQIGEQIKMKRALKFIISGMLPNLNDYTSANRSNKYSGANMKSGTERGIRYSIRKHIKKQPIIEKAFITFIWYEENKKRDPDNIAFAKKFILDAMVSEKIIRNDGWKCIIGFKDVFEVDKENPRVEIYIDEIEGDTET